MLTGSMLCATGTMSADSSAFSCLPLAVRDSLLQQAFQQLDQRHLFGVAPRVCRLWHQLSLSMVTSLNVKITTEEAAEQLSLWMKKHGAAGLDSLVLLVDQAVCPTPAARSLLQSFEAAMQLRSLDLSTTYCNAVLDVPFPPLTNLTSLSINTCSLAPIVVSSILNLSSLTSLSLRHSHVVDGGMDPWSSFMGQMATCLVAVTCLTLALPLSNEGLVHLHAFPQLKRLSVGLSVAASGLRHLSGLPVTSIYIRATTEEMTDVSTWLHSAASGLEHLVLHNLDRRPAAPASFVPVHKAVHVDPLYLWNVKPDISLLAALTQLTTLSLRGCDMYDADVCMLSALTGLRSLELSYNPGITGAQGSMEVSARSMPQLHSLDLLRTGAQEAAQRAFDGRDLRLRA